MGRTPFRLFISSLCSSKLFPTFRIDHLTDILFPSKMKKNKLICNLIHQKIVFKRTPRKLLGIKGSCNVPVGILKTKNNLFFLFVSFSTI